MTAPVAQEDIVAAATKYLLAQPDVVAAVGSDTDGIWLTQYRLWHGFEGSQSTAVVITHEGGWASPNLHNTLRFPRLLVSVFGDPLRDPGNNAVDYGEVNRRVNAVFEVIDKYLHRPAGGQVMFSTLRIVSSVRLTEPAIYTVPEGDGGLRLQAYYAITQG